MAKARVLNLLILFKLFHFFLTDRSFTEMATLSMAENLLSSLQHRILGNHLRTNQNRPPNLGSPGYSSHLSLLSSNIENTILGVNGPGAANAFANGAQADKDNSATQSAVSHFQQNFAVIQERGHLAQLMQLLLSVFCQEFEQTYVECVQSVLSAAENPPKEPSGSKQKGVGRSSASKEKLDQIS